MRRRSHCACRISQQDEPAISTCLLCACCCCCAVRLYASRIIHRCDERELIYPTVGAPNIYELVCTCTGSTGTASGRSYPVPRTCMPVVATTLAIALQSCGDDSSGALVVVALFAHHSIRRACLKRRCERWHAKCACSADMKGRSAALLWTRASCTPAPLTVRLEHGTPIALGRYECSRGTVAGCAA